MLSANVAPTFAGILMYSKHQTEAVSLCLKSHRLVNTLQPFYNTTVGVHGINRVSSTTVLYPNKMYRLY